MCNIKLVKMPGWYYDKKELRNTPSAADGIDYKTEMRYRKEGNYCFNVFVGQTSLFAYNTYNFATPSSMIESLIENIHIQFE